MKRLSESERSEVWDRLEAGESVASVARRLGRARSSVRSHVVAAGFRRPVPAAEWSPLRLSLTEREEISRGVAVGESWACQVFCVGCRVHVVGSRRPG